MLTNLANIALIILGFGVLIFFHELGHFLAAKWAGIRAEAFAIGMGPVIVAYRKGIGFRAGSTERAVMTRVNEHLRANDISLGEDTVESIRLGHIYRAMDELGIGETEYSLRWLPIGGFVRMLGQEDANPNAVSSHPQSYGRASIGRRMVVVSAGVLMNLVLAVLFFMWAFLVGVKFEAPVIGDVLVGMPAATAVAENASEAGVTERGLKPGDRVLSIAGEEVEAFKDILIAAAMGRSDEPLEVEIERRVGGEPRRLRFSMTPKESDGLLAFGVTPAYSTTLHNETPTGDVVRMLDHAGLSEHGVVPGMRLLAAEGEPVRYWSDIEELARDSQGQALESEWSAIDATGAPVGEIVRAPLVVEPQFSVLRSASAGVPVGDPGLLGLSPLVRVGAVSPDSPNRTLLQRGDTFISVAGTQFPRASQVIGIVSSRIGATVPVTVLRDGEEIDLALTVNQLGQIGIELDRAFDQPIVAAPIEEYALPRATVEDPLRTAPSPVASAGIVAGSRLLEVNGRTIADWAAFRTILRDATADTDAREQGATVQLRLAAPDGAIADIPLSLTPEDVTALHSLTWQTTLPGGLMQMEQELVTAEGNPLVAIGMGFEHTWKFILNTYLTLDRLFRGTVGVDQLRGPVGIVHLGTQIGDRGLMFIIFFLAMISVNLAVINFLPLPIVDGGLFLFLVYEKVKGRPPSLAFQNGATIAGLVMIGTILLVTLYNDVARLLGA